MQTVTRIVDPWPVGGEAPQEYLGPDAALRHQQVLVDPALRLLRNPQESPQEYLGPDAALEHQQVLVDPDALLNTRNPQESSGILKNPQGSSRIIGNPKESL